MPKDMLRIRIELDKKGNMITNERGAVLIHEERLHWSHELVGRAAALLGWPDFPGEDESLDRAHFYQAYRAEINRLMENEGELPAVREYIEELRRNASLPIGQELKKLVERIPHEEF
jgi:hypothetical protein